MRALICSLLLMFACVSAMAQDGGPLWHWYYVSPPYPNPGERPFLRLGTARVALAKARIRIDFVESDFPEMKPTFEGRVAKSGDVRGELKNFFLEGPPARLPGKYREEKYGGCRFQEIMIRPASGAILMLSRGQGKCAPEPDR